MTRTSRKRAERQAKRLYEMCALAIVSGHADLDGADRVGFDIELPVFSVGRAGELANVHPQTLRQYDRLGLVVPQRTAGGARRYSLRDIARLANAQHLSQEEGINLAGVTRILKLEEENRELRRQVERLRKPAGTSVFAADADGGIVEVERSRRARMWRHQIRVDMRQLPSRDSSEISREDDGKTSTSVVLWGDR
ncbi:heat shock protein transcriptional repressor HspR [uncultured Bifidobacterium sp.]|uniref:heat shock protein transcriptional repressor HspR n=1 Tax=uncultured Bifidobacterium sp. TaxID=165187 RepID=UPI000EC9379A|nr:helix-turn-helix transcriptional regulator [uncultured Bifidobacterium sp.]HCH22194.1 MerR family transcriptional regulator [Bifidobacterium sp.]